MRVPPTTYRPALLDTFCNLSQQYHVAEKKGGRIEKTYIIAGRIVRLRFAGTELVPFTTRALEHLEIHESSHPDLTICLWDHQSTGVSMPAPPILPGIYSLSGNELYIALRSQHQWIEGFSPHSRLAVSWIADRKHYPPYVHAAPLRTILAWWLKQHGLNGLHAAAIGTTTGGVLLGGAGRSGKSTTAFACLNAGFLYLGDDFCILDFDPSPRVYSLYNSGKLPDDNRKWFPQLESTATGMKDDGKIIYHFCPDRKQQMVKSLPIRVVLLPNVTKEHCTRLKPASGGEALNVLAPTTLKLMALPAGSLKPTLGAIAKLVRKVPCYHLELGEEFTDIPHAVSLALRGDL